MPVIAWDSRFLTGNAEVDHQHQELFALINALDDAVSAGRGRELLIPTLDRLAAYVVKHFRTEESLMRSRGYPGAIAHQALHQDLDRQTGAMIDAYKTGRLGLTITLSHFLADWLTAHILKEDLAMIAWVKTHR